jgi:hypothetical protein
MPVTEHVEPQLQESSGVQKGAKKYIFQVKKLIEVHNLIKLLVS